MADLNQSSSIDTGKLDSTASPATTYQGGTPSTSATQSVVPNATSTWGAMAPISPITVNSKAADTDYANIQANHANLVAGMETQATKNAQTQADTAAKAAADKAAAEAKAKQDADIANQTAAIKVKQDALAGGTKDTNLDVLGKTGFNPLTGTTSTVNNIAKNPDGSYSVTFSDGSSTQRVDANQINNVVNPDQGKINYATTQEANAKQKAEDIKTQTANQIMGIQNGTIPLDAGQNAQVEELKRQFNQMIDQQTLINTGATGLGNIRGYQTGAAEYDPTFQAKTMGSIISAGQSKIAGLNIEMAAAVAKMTQGFKDKNIAAVKDANDILVSAQEDRAKTFQKMIDDAQKMIKEAQDKVKEQEKKTYDQVTKPIQDIQKELSLTPGVPASVIAAVSKAKTVEEAMAAAGTYLQKGTGDVADYLLGAKQAQAAGVTFPTYDKWTLARDKAKANLKYSEAYATAMGKAAAEAATGNVQGTTVEVPPTALVGSGKNGSILKATGISLPAFNFLTQGTASMSRMSAKQRNQIMKEAEGWLNSRGIDVSTFQSQYKAYNDVLQKNLARANQTRIMAGEVAGSADALMEVIATKDMSNIKAANILDLMAGKELNDPTAQKYAFQLKTMANDLAGYFAASRGATTPELQDQREAADVIANGMNTKSTQAFKDAVIANEEKVNKVVDGAADRAQQQVWSLFGVGDQYDPTSKLSPNQKITQNLQAEKESAEQAKSHVNNFYTSTTPENKKLIENLLNQNYSDADVMEYLKLKGITQ